MSRIYLAQCRGNRTLRREAEAVVQLLDAQDRDQFDAGLATFAETTGLEPLVWTQQLDEDVGDYVDISRPMSDQEWHNTLVDKLTKQLVGMGRVVVGLPKTAAEAWDLLAQPNTLDLASV